ncbi:MAG: WYL domain-containing protein [Clostridiales bacterium]|nr:WYL domain-containing protein [Clostridiales bacterium]
MEKQQNQIRLIELLKYLWQNTDRQHYATIVDMQKHLQTLGFNPDRKTLSKDIEMLNSIGFFDIEHDRNVQNRYYITRRFFNEADVKMLCDAVRSSYIISDKEAKEFVSTFETFVGPSARAGLNSPAFIDATSRTKNNNVIKNAGKIAKAITGKKKISFKYFNYTVEGKKEHKGNKRYLVSPYAMLIDDGKYYFAGFDDEAGIVKNFRVDKVDCLTVTTFDAAPQPRSFSAKKFASQTRMFPGYESKVEFYCHKDTMYGIMDKFGTKVKTEKIDDEHFKATVTAEVSPTFFGWVLGYGGNIRIIGPENVVEDFKNTVQSVLMQKE